MGPDRGRFAAFQMSHEMTDRDFSYNRTWKSLHFDQKYNYTRIHACREYEQFLR